MHEREFRITVPLPIGDVEVSAAAGTPEPEIETWATVVVTHGAGAAYDQPVLVDYARALRVAGIATLRFNFPYREQGRSFPDRPPAAIATWNAAYASAASFTPPAIPIWASGRSFGGRMASMAAAAGMDVAGLVYLAYPLHAPGKPDVLRREHLDAITAPQLFLQGTNDPFAIPNAALDAIAMRIPQAQVQWIAGGDHSFGVKGQKRTPNEIADDLAARTIAFMRANSRGAEETAAPRQL